MLNLPILMYHKVGKPTSKIKIKGLYVTPCQFEGHLQWLQKQGFSFCDFFDLNNYFERGMPLPSRPICLTFDDGHLDNYTQAFPLLKKYRAKATIFVLAGDIGKHQLVWSEAAEDEPTDLFTWDQAREMEQAGIRIESHGMTHRHLDRLSSDEVE